MCLLIGLLEVLGVFGRLLILGRSDLAALILNLDAVVDVSGEYIVNWEVDR